MIKRFYILLLAIVASVGMSWAQGPWTSGDCTLTLDGGVMTVSGNGAMADYNNSNPWKSYNSSITSIVIEDGVTHVGNGTFPQCTSLVSVVIGDDVETIGEFTFDDAGASLISVTMGNKVKSIGMAAFLWDTGLPELILSENLETIGDYAFCRMEALTTITIPSKVTSIGAAAFSNCSALQSIYIEATTPPTLGDGVFSNVNADLSTIPLYVPNGSVAAYTAAAQWNAFDIQGYDPAPGGGSTPANSCGDGLTWELSEGVLTISYDGVGTGEMTDFDYEYDQDPVNVAPWKENKSEITTVIVGDGVKSIGNYAFNDLYENFTAVTIANSVERIGLNAFMNAKWITEITLPSSLKTIDKECFAANFGFTSITIPSGVTSIGNKAFCYCTGLTSLTCEATTPPTLGSSVFYKITSKTSDMSNIPLYVPSESVAAYEAAAQWNAFDVQAIPGGGSTPANSCGDGVIWELNNGALTISYTGTGTGVMDNYASASDAPWYSYKNDITSVTITDGVKSVGSYSFGYYGNLVTVTIGNDVETIGYYAFGDCYKFTTLNLGNSVKHIGDRAFMWAKVLTGFTLPSTLETIGERAFLQNKVITSLTIPSNVTSIGESAFMYCAALTSVTVEATTPPTLGATVFEGVPTSSIPLHVPSGSVAAYTAADQWNAFDIQDPTPAYEKVMNLINEIGTVELTAECKAKIDAARAAFIALSDGDKAQVSNIATLTDAEAAFDNVMDIWLSGDCDAILWKDTTLTIRKHAGEGNGAMADYTDYYGDNTAPWFNSHWYNPQPGDIVIKSVTLEEGVTHIGENAFGWMSELKTITIPSSMTSIGEDAFYWSKAVDDIYLSSDPSNLTWVLPYSADNQFKPEKATLCHVPADLLTAYQETFGTLNMTFVGDLAPVDPAAGAAAIVDLINAIGTVEYTDECKAKIDAAREAYDKAVDAVKDLISADDLKKLTDAETEYADLKAAADQAAAAPVIAKINNIPQPVTLKLDTRDSIESARAAYDALTDDQKLLVSNYDVLTAAETALAALNPGGGMPADALNGKFTINAGGDQIAFAKGNLQATTEDLGEHWTWSFAANQWNYLGIAVANSKINGNGTVSENGTVDLFGWSTAATYYGINNSYKAVDYIGDFVDWGPNMGAGWRTLTKDEWNYLIENNTKGRATVNDKNGYIFLPNDWSGPAFTQDPDNFTTNVYSGDDWTAMENAGAVFLPSGPARNGAYALIANDAKYSSSTSLNNDTSYVFTIYYNQSQSACTGTNRAYGCMVRLVTEGGGATPLDSAQAVKDLIEAIPVPVTLDDACVNAVQAARDAYDALSDNAKGALDEATVQKLTDAEKALKDLNQAVADEVIAKINNIPTPVELKLATRDSIQNARAAYDALNAAQQALVTNYQTLLDAEAALAELNKGGSTPVDIVWDGNTGIANVSPTTTSPAYEGMTVTVGQGSSFSTYQNRLYFTFNSQPNGGFIFANENGTNITKVVIESTSALTSTMTEVDRMGSGWVISNENKTATWTGNTDSVSIWKGEHFANYWVVDMITFTVNGTATPLDSAQTVKDLIDAIPTPVEYPTSGLAIAAALVAYNQLSDAAKGALDAADVQKMTDAAIQYAALDAIAAIEAIPAEIVYDPAVKAAIETAREKYDALIDASKALIDAEVVAKLTNAEQAWADLVALIEHNVSYIGKDGELKNEKVALLNIPNPAPEFNGFAFDQWIVKAGDFLEEGLRIKAVYTPIITTDPVAFDTLVYNGTAQTLIAAGVASDGHIEYRLNDGEWSDELPQAEMAAAYVVDYKLVREGHEDYMAGSIVATIAKAPVAYTAPTAVETLVYNASNQTLIAAGQTKDGIFEYSLDPTLLDSWKTELPQAMNAGTYNVYFRVNGDMNHLDSTAVDPIAVTIAKAELTATADDKNVIYGDAVPEYSVTYAGWQGDDDAAVLTGEIAFACDYDQTSDVGEYAITPSGVTAKNYTITFVDGKLTVSKAASSCEAPVAFDTLVYNGFAQTLIEAGLPTGGEMQYSLDTTLLGSWSTELPQAKDAGAYKVFYRVKGDLNHNDQDYDQPIELSIALAALMITAEDKSVIYGDAVPEFTAAYEGWMNSDDASVVSGLTYTCEYAPTSNVGEYAIVPSGATAMNYAISYTNGKLTVAQAALMITAEDKSVIYGDAVPEYTATYEGWKNGDDASVVSGLTYTCEYAPTSNVGEYAIVPSGAEALNYAISYTNGKLTVFKGTLTITANDTVMIYGDEAPAFTASYSGWLNGDDESLVSGLAFTTPYQPGSPVGTYAIQPVNATADNYQINFVEGTLTVNKAIVSVSGAEAQEAKFADGHTGAKVLNAGTLNGIKLNDPLTHVTTAVFSSAEVSEHLTITLFYELTGDAALLANYDLQSTSEVFTTEGVIIEPFLPNNDDDPEDKESKVQEGIEVYAYGYCEGDNVGLKYHLNSGNPDQYKIEFEDSRFADVDWTLLDEKGPEGVIYITVPVDIPTGDYQMTVTFRDSRFAWLESQPLSVTFHVNLPETYVRPLFDNTIVLVDTCECFTDIQWYHRADASEQWQPISGANGHYLHVEGKLTGEYFVKAKMNGVETYTCEQTDMQTLYGAETNKQAKVKAYPNPVIDNTNVTIENSEAWEHNLRIVNLMGVEMNSSTFEGDHTVVEMSGYPQGNYMISVDGIMVKVLKQ